MSEFYKPWMKNINRRLIKKLWEKKGGETFLTMPPEYGIQIRYRKIYSGIIISCVVDGGEMKKIGINPETKEYSR